MAVFGRSAGHPPAGPGSAISPSALTTATGSPVTVREVVSVGPGFAVRRCARPTPCDRPCCRRRGESSAFGLSARARRSPPDPLRRPSDSAPSSQRHWRSEPALLALDEPTTGVDGGVAGVAGGASWASSASDFGVTILYVSHEFGAGSSTCLTTPAGARGESPSTGRPDELAAAWHDPSHDHRNHHH